LPLSEEEQRILHEMEQKLKDHDRGFYDRVNNESGRNNAGRACRWAVLIFVAGFVLLVASFRASLLLGTFGFLVMLISAMFFEHNLRQLDGPLFGPFSRALRRRGISDEITDLQRRMRDRFKRPH